MPEARSYVEADGTCPFDAAYEGLRDERAKARIDTTIEMLERGLKPDVKSVGDGVHEARIDYGPGYRVYFGNDGAQLIVLLLCGDKGSQDVDIAHAKGHWVKYQAAKKAPPSGTPLLRQRD